jgi:hypothetical protein
MTIRDRVDQWRDKKTFEVATELICQKYRHYLASHEGKRTALNEERSGSVLKEVKFNDF